jgi:Cu(I)/Ag(I) efflux system membrane fusion protein
MSDPVKSVRLNGKIQADPRRVFSQSSHIGGRIESLAVSFVGQRVQAGQMIATMYSPELVRAQDELIEALKMKQTRPELIVAAREKLMNWKLSRAQIDDIMSSKTSQPLFSLTADDTGFVTRIRVGAGAYVERGSVLYDLVDLSRVWILLDVHESDLVWVRSGDRVDVTAAALPGDTFQGEIVYIDPVIDPRTRVARARVDMDNRDMAFKPDMFVAGQVSARLDRQALTVPKTAVMWTGRRSVVYVRDSDGEPFRFRLREVTLGPALADDYIVDQGLSEGETIAVHGTFSIDAAAQLAGKPSMMSPDGSAGMTPSHHGVLLPDLKTQTINHEGALPMLDDHARRQLQGLYADYLAFKDALVADDIETARSKASAFTSRLDGLTMTTLTGKAHEIWMETQGSLASSLAHVAHQETLDDLRKIFQAVSRAMIAMARSLGPPGRTLYIQHCPMADDNKGADWLSEDKAIRNPYYGASMLSCGEVTATLASPIIDNNQKE